MKITIYLFINATKTKKHLQTPFLVLSLRSVSKKNE